MRPLLLFLLVGFQVLSTRCASAIEPTKCAASAAKTALKDLASQDLPSHGETRTLDAPLAHVVSDKLPSWTRGSDSTGGFARFRAAYRSGDFSGPARYILFKNLEDGTKPSLAAARVVGFEVRNGTRHLIADVYPVGRKQATRRALLPDEIESARSEVEARTIIPNNQGAVGEAAKSPVEEKAATLLSKSGNIVANISPRATASKRKIEMVLSHLDQVYAGEISDYATLGVRKNESLRTLLKEFQTQVKNRQMVIEVVPGGKEDTLQLGSGRISIGSDLLESDEGLAAILHEISHTFQRLPDSPGDPLVLLREIDANLFGAAYGLYEATMMTLMQYPGLAKSLDLPFRQLSPQELLNRVRGIYSSYGSYGNFIALRRTM